MQAVTLPSRPADGPVEVIVRPGPRSGAGERHVEVLLKGPSKEPILVSARFKDVPAREHLVALQAKDDGALAREFQELGLIESKPLRARLDGGPALICVAAGALLAEVLKAKSFKAHPPQGALVKPEPVEEPPPAKARRKLKESGE